MIQPANVAQPAPQAPIILITGASGNLGRAVAQHFLDAGAQLALLDHDANALQQHYGHWPAQRTLLLPCNLLEPQAVQQAAALATARFGRIDVLCNLAGGFDMGPPVHDTPLQMWQRQYELNVLTALHISQAIVPGMVAQGSGKIVHIGAFAAQKGAAHMGAYTAAKAALIRMTESMAAELRGQGINVNCVLPTIIDTPANRAAMPDADPTQWVPPEKLAAIIAFLCSEAASPIHGAALPVTGLS